MRLIDADDLLEGREDHEMISTHLIWNAPTIEAEPVRHGRWERHFPDQMYMPICAGIVLSADIKTIINMRIDIITTALTAEQRWTEVKNERK